MLRGLQRVFGLMIVKTWVVLVALRSFCSLLSTWLFPGYEEVSGKWPVHKGHFAAGKPEYWLPETECSSRKSSQHQQINGNKKQSQAIHSYKNPHVCISTLLFLCHFIFSMYRLYCSKFAFDWGRMEWGKAESIQNKFENNNLCHISIFSFNQNELTHFKYTAYSFWTHKVGARYWDLKEAWISTP